MEFIAFLLLTTIFEGSVFVYNKDLIPGYSGKVPIPIECNDIQQKEMTDDFQQCLNEFTKEYYEQKAENPEKSQENTCNLLVETVTNCGEIWNRCYSPDEVRNIKDMHIQARIGQFQNNIDEIEVVKCSVVKEYLESGRAEDVDQSIRGSCSIAEVSAVQRELQQCSHNISLNLFYDIQRLEEGFMESIVHDDQNKTKLVKDMTNLNPTMAKKSRLCMALETIAKDCIKSFKKCFSKEDAKRINRQHIQQLREYYEKIYMDENGENLSNCQELKFLNEEHI